MHDSPDYEDSVQRRLAVSERRFRCLFEAMSEGVAIHKVLLDEQGTPVDYVWLDANPAFERLTGLCRIDILGKRVREVLPGVEDYWIESYGRIALNGGSISFENVARDLGKTYSVTAYQTEPGYFAVLVRDVTHERRAEAVLTEARDLAQRASNAKSEFLANMSHELRTPLNAIVGFSELLALRSLGSEEMAMVHHITESAQVLLRLIADLLDLSKIEAGKLTLRPEPVDWEALAQEVCDSFLPQAAHKTLTLSFAVSPELRGNHHHDPVRLKQILGNLLNNSIKFTEKGRITLQITRLPSERVRIAVSDTGIGIPPGELPRIFEKFEQGELPVNLVAGGAGLGLAIVKSLVQLMNGEVGVESTVGIGATVWVNLPLAM